MAVDKLFFSPIKETRDGYFVEYRPPSSGYRFATLQVICLLGTDHEYVASTMEREAKIWYERYPVPIMVSAFDLSGDLLDLKESRTRPVSHLVIFGNAGSAAAGLHWSLLENDKIPSDALSREYLLNVYSGVPYRTSADVNTEATRQAKWNRVALYALVTWVCALPAAFLILEYFGPQWLAAIVLVYGLFKIAISALKMLGKWRKSSSELAKESEERLMRHHHYHCKLNPEGFRRLLEENIDQDSKRRTIEEARRIDVH